MQYHGTIPWATTNHVQDLNHLWLNPKSRLTLKIPPLNLTWSNHQLPSSIYRGILHTPPDFTGELPGVCMPYQVLQPYAHLHANRSITFFSCAFMVTTPSPSLASSSRFPCSLPCSYFSMLPLYLYHWCPYKEKSIYRMTWVIGHCNRQFSRNSLHIHGSSILVPKPRLNHLTFLP